MNSIVENQLNIFISDKIVTNRKILSEAFNIRCEKITLNNNDVFIAKFYIKQNIKFNSIISETNSLIYLLKKFQNFFPSIRYYSKNLLIMNFIKHNNVKDKNYQKILADHILKLHFVENDKYGFNFDTQIGGLRQSNKFDLNWVNFFRDNRLNMIFEKISKSNLMSLEINFKIEKLIKNLDKYIPNNPRPSLLHGDLWDGNILFNNCKLVGLIDPGPFFGHSEMEIAYLTWFKYVDNIFLNFYKERNNINIQYAEYEPIYQLYYSLLNIYLWDRKYIKNTLSLLNKIKI